MNNTQVWTMDNRNDTAKVVEVLREVEEMKEALKTLERLHKKEKLTTQELRELMHARSIAKYAKVMGF